MKFKQSQLCGFGDETCRQPDEYKYVFLRCLRTSNVS